MGEVNQSDVSYPEHKKLIIFWELCANRSECSRKRYNRFKKFQLYLRVNELIHLIDFVYYRSTDRLTGNQLKCGILGK